MDYDKYYEYIVIGCGGVGSGALFWLAKKVGKGKFIIYILKSKSEPRGKFIWQIPTTYGLGHVFSVKNKHIEVPMQ